MKCIKLVKEMSGKTEEESRWMSEGPQSPSGVLNVRCLSYNSNESTAVGSCANSSSQHNGSNGSKRRRLNRACEVEL